MPFFPDDANIDNFLVICRIARWIGDGEVGAVGSAGWKDSCFSSSFWICDFACIVIGWEWRAQKD